MFGDINRIAKTMTSWFVPWFTCCVPDSSVFIKTTACVTMEHDPVRALSKQLKVVVRAWYSHRGCWAQGDSAKSILVVPTNQNWSHCGFRNQSLVVLHQDRWADGRTWRGRNRCLRVHGPRMSLQDCSAGFRKLRGKSFQSDKIVCFSTCDSQVCTEIFALWLTRTLWWYCPMTHKKRQSASYCGIFNCICVLLTVISSRKHRNQKFKIREKSHWP